MNTRRNLLNLAWSTERQAQALKKNGPIELAQSLARRSLSIKSSAWSLQPQPIPITARTKPSFIPT